MTKRIAILTTAFVLCLLSCGLAQTVEIVAPATVPEHTIIVFQTSEAGTGHTWRVKGPTNNAVEFRMFGHQGVFTGPPGEYTILQRWIASDGQERKSWAETTILPGEDDGDRSDPIPPPPPEPVIESGERWVVIIEETADRQSLTPGQLDLIASRSLDPYCRQNGHRLRIYDQDAKNPAGNASQVIAPYLRLLDGVSLPAVVLLDAKDNATMYVGPLPDDTDAMIELLKSKGG